VSRVSWSANDIICLASKPALGNLYLAPSNLFLLVLLTALLDNLIVTVGNLFPRYLPPNDTIFLSAEATIVFRNIHYRKKDEQK